MIRKQRILVTGASGQLGQAISKHSPNGMEIIAFDRKRLDISNSLKVEECISTYKPDVVINAAAYTAVDQAESESSLARSINTEGARNVAAISARHNAWPIQISTDFVFDGESASPYSSTDRTNPISVYGQTKRDGEVAVQEGSGGKATILRTAWVYGPVGKNFLLTILRILRRNDQIRVVSDQVGTPTSTHSIVRALFEIVRQDIGRGDILHWTDAGVGSWYDFASQIRCIAASRGEKALARVEPISTADYPTPARRPSYSVLRRSKELVAALGESGNCWWQSEVATVLNELTEAGL